jgi:hypothetical protein
VHCPAGACREVQKQILFPPSILKLQVVMMPKDRFPHDRRKGKDRRSHLDQGYFLKGGIERRSGWERRTKGERRWNWVRVDKWSSAGLPYSENTTFLRPKFKSKRSV